MTPAPRNPDRPQDRWGRPKREYPWTPAPAGSSGEAGDARQDAVLAGRDDTTEAGEHDAGFRPHHRPGTFLDKRDHRPNLHEAIERAADPLAVAEWEARHGLTVASVSRYLLNVLGPS